MNKIVSLWPALPLTLALAATLACEGITASKQETQKSLTFSGTGVLAGNLVTNPASLGFGNVQLGTTASLTETLKNTGAKELTVSAAKVSGAGFNITGLNLPLVLGPNQSSTFGVRFTPRTVGSSNGALSLTIPGSSTSVEAALSGEGMSPAGLVATRPSITFTNLPVGAAQTQTETVRNEGGSSATISYVTVAGNGFSVSGLAPPFTVAPGQSTSFTITFAPKSSGSFTGSISLASDPSQPLLTALLSGSATGTLGRLSVNPGTVNVGNVAIGSSAMQTGTLTASYDSVIVSSVISASSEFSIGGLKLPVTIAPGQSVAFSVTFTPQSSGSASVPAVFASNAVNSPTTTILAGNGIARTPHTVDLSWAASTSSDVVSYNIYRSIYGMSCESYDRVGSTSGTTYTDTNVSGGTTYCYVATAVNSRSDETVYSVPVQAVVPLP